MRRIRDTFKENKNVTDPQEISKMLIEAQKTLEVIKRQVFLKNSSVKLFKLTCILFAGCNRTFVQC